MYNTPNSIISIVQQANELFNITADEAMKFLNKYYKNCLEMTRKKKKNIKKLVNSLYREHVSPEAYIKTITGINESQLYNTLYMYSILYKNLLGNKISEDELYQLCYDQGFLLIDYYKEDESIKDTEIEKFIIEFNNTYK